MSILLLSLMRGSGLGELDFLQGPMGRSKSPFAEKGQLFGEEEGLDLDEIPIFGKLGGQSLLKPSGLSDSILSSPQERIQSILELVLQEVESFMEELNELGILDNIGGLNAGGFDIGGFDIPGMSNFMPKTKGFMNLDTIPFPLQQQSPPITQIPPPVVNKTTAPPPVEPGSYTGQVPPELKQYETIILEASAETGVPADLLSAMIWDESRGNINASSVNGQSGAGDVGLMQMGDDRFNDLKSKHPELQGMSLSTAEGQIHAAAWFMHDLKAEFGTWDLALRGYNSGELSVDRSNPHNIVTQPNGMKYGNPEYINQVHRNLDAIHNGTPLPP